MISPAEIKVKAEKKYPAYLQSVVEGLPFAEIVITGNKKPSKNITEFEKELTELKSQSKEKKGYGYSIKYQTVSKKDIGTQDLPTEISFQTESDFLKYFHKEKEVVEFRQNCRLILFKFPELKEWIIKYPKKVIENHSQWNGLLKVCNYFTETSKPNLYIRELPIQVHTKFIEGCKNKPNNKPIITELLNILIKDHIQQNEKDFEKRFNMKCDEPKVRFRILDKQIASTYFSEIDDLSIPINKFKQLNLPLKKVFVVTNNPFVATELPVEVRYIDCDTEELLVSVRDMVYEGYPLMSHPLPSSIRMIYSPYRSVVLGAEAGAPDSWHVGIAEESLRKYRQNTGHRALDKISAEAGESYRWMDAQLLSVALKESESLY